MNRIPSTMRAVRFVRGGGPEVLETRVVPTPAPRAGEVLVRVHAAGLNPKDVLLRARARRAASRGTGFDFAGEVAACGDGVRDLALGQRVWGFLDGASGGTAADHVVVPRAWLAAAPLGISWAEAAAIPLAASTALQALRDVARLRAGDRLLIKGASGGVGSAAIQVAKALGAEVTAITSGPGLAHVRALGADVAIDRRTSDLTAMRRGFDVFLDCAGGSGIRAHRRLLARGGRWVTVAPNVAVFALAPLSPLVSRVLGGVRFGFVVVRPRASDLEVLARLVWEGRLRMPVAGAWPLAEIADAHAAVAAGGALGKRVVLVSPEAEGERCLRTAEPARGAARLVEVGT